MNPEQILGALIRINTVNPRAGNREAAVKNEN